MWRYLEVLPVASGRPELSMGEGGTPLIRADSLGMMLGLSNLYIKDERQGPSGSFKDRQAALTMAVLKEHSQVEAVVASTGNVAISYSAYGARAGVKVWAFLTSLVPADKMHEVAVYGTRVVKVTSSYDNAKLLAARFAQDRNLYLDRGVRSIPAVEAMKTIAYELCEQLGLLTGEHWRAPDWYFQPVSGGIGPVGVSKGFKELHNAGFIHKLPALGIVQAEGCSPMAQAWKCGADEAAVVEDPSTHISTLTTGDPGRSYQLLRSYMTDGTGGIMESVSDAEAFRAMHLLAELEGISVEPAAAVGFAGLIKLAQMGKLDRDALIVVNCTGHTMPVGEELLAEGWSEEVLLGSDSLPDSPQDGLLAALARLDQRRTQEVLIVDDNAESRRLIRRILQAHGDFTLREAEDGAQGLASARQSPPDLLILDLMMPAVDGFKVLDELRLDPQTSEIPVIVVTARALTPGERERLRGRISHLMIKGDFLNEDLIDEIQQALT